MLLSVKSDIERSIDYFSEHTEGNKMAANSKELVILIICVVIHYKNMMKNII